MPKDFKPQYDIAFVRSNGDTQGFMLAEDKNGRKLYKKSRLPVLAPQMFVDQATEANFPSDQDLVIAAETELHGGMGELNHSYGKMYGESTGWDSTVKGELKLSPQERSATVTRQTALDSTAFSNLDFDDWTAGDPDDWGMVLGNCEATKWDKQKLMPNGLRPFWQEHINRLGDGHTGCFNCQMRCKEYYDIAELVVLALGL